MKKSVDEVLSNAEAGTYNRTSPALVDAERVMMFKPASPAIVTEGGAPKETTEILLRSGKSMRVLGEYITVARGFGWTWGGMPTRAFPEKESKS